MWRVYLGDTMSGALTQPIDVPGFTWTVSVSDATFNIGRDKEKGVGEDDASGVNLPMSSVPARTVAERCSMLMPYKRSLLLAWEDRYGRLFPVCWGAIGPRTDTLDETSFDLVSPLELLDSRFLVREGTFGAVSGMTDVSVPDEWEPDRENGYREGATVQHNGREWKSLVDDNHDEPGTSDKWEDQGPVVGPQPATFTRDTIYFSGMSLRGIASEVGRLCTDAKPGGALPIDWSYLGEAGGHERTYDGFDVGNDSCRDILEKISNVIGGPDIQLRPYMSDEGHVRVKLIAGSDADAFVGQSVVHGLSFVRGHGGNVENLSVDFNGPVMRVYATGSGTDEAKICHLAEDLSLCRMGDPWPLVESHYNDSDADSGELLSQHAQAQLESGDVPQMQVRFDMDLNDATVPPVGSIWPGELVDLYVEGFPTLPDGTYTLRVMEMSGNDTSTVSVITRQEVAPIY